MATGGSKMSEVRSETKALEKSRGDSSTTIYSKSMANGNEGSKKGGSKWKRGGKTFTSSLVKSH